MGYSTTSAFMETLPTGWLNGHLVNTLQPLIMAADSGLGRAYAVFDFFRVYRQRPLFMQAHLQRLNASASYMHLNIAYSDDVLQEAVIQLIKANAVSSGAIKIIITGGNSADGYSPATPNVLITAHSIAPMPHLLPNGVSAITYDYHKPFAQVKTTNYSMGIWLLPYLKEHNAAEVIYTHKGQVLETPRSNIFIVNNEGHLITPYKEVLHGITRGHVLKLASAFMPVAERAVTTEELLTAKEVFITSTTKRLLPLTCINGQYICKGTPGPVSKLLFEQLLMLDDA